MENLWKAALKSAYRVESAKLKKIPHAEEAAGSMSTAPSTGPKRAAFVASPDGDRLSILSARDDD